MSKKPIISHFQRKIDSDAFSLEILGESIRTYLTRRFKFIIVENRFKSSGFFKRLIDTIFSAFRQGDINHILGDVHYLSYFLRKKRTILTIADCVSLKRLTGLKKAVVYFFWYWLPVKRVSTVVVISDYIKNELLGYINVEPEKIQVIHIANSWEPRYKIDS